jgi:pimeloyl-ACP methyl ester carboxylesterase
VAAPDLPGAGSTEARGLDDLTAEGTVAHVEPLLGDDVHVVAHGESSLAALRLAREGKVRSVFLIAPNAAAPIGDSVQSVSLLHPPEPRFTRRSQRWALERLAYVPDRAEAVLDTLLENASGAAHKGAVELLADPVNAAKLLAAQIEEQDAFYAHCRDVRHRIPIGIFWGAADPTATVARGTVLASILGGGPAHLHFQLVNRCAHLAQYDQPERLAATVQAFLERST